MSMRHTTVSLISSSLHFHCVITANDVVAGKPPPIVRAPGEEGKEDSKSQADKEDDRWGFEDDEKKGDEGSTSSNDTDDGEPPVAWAKPTKGEKKDRKAAKQKATDPFSNAGAVEGDLSSAVGDWRKKLFVPQGDYQ